MRAMIYAGVFASALAACGEQQAPTEEILEGQGPAEDVAAAAVSIIPKAPGTDFPDATIQEWSYHDSKFEFAVDASTYELGEQSPDAGATMCANSDKGQHIHLIIDNEPYSAQYTADFEYEIPDGEHEILAFLSRSYHESIKTPAAHRAVTATVTANGFEQTTDIAEPMLFYSRPKGTYVGKDAESLLLDFYPVGVELGADYQVKVEVGGTTAVLDRWQPYLINGLPMGEHTVTLSLVDGDGALVEAPHNPVSRTFTLEADPLPQG